MSNSNSLMKWADDLQKKEKLLQDKEKELETKLKRTSLSEMPPPRLGHSNSTANLISTLKESDKSPGPPQAEPKKSSASGRFKASASRKPFRLQPLSEKNSLDGASPPSTSLSSTSSSTQASPPPSSLPPSASLLPPPHPSSSTSVSHSFAHSPSTNSPPSLAPMRESTAVPHVSKSLAFSKMHAKNRSIKNLAIKEAISDKQVAEALSAFNTVDKDHNGVIDSFELYDALKVLYGEDISRPEANKFYLSIDSNRSGFITFDEFLHATIQYHWDISLLQNVKAPKPSKQLSTGLDHHEWEIPYEELVFETKLGEGTYGVVYKGKWRHTTVAIKELKVSEMKEKLLTDFRNEISIMGRLRHPNVILYMGACTKEPHFCIVTELLPGGSIYDVLHTRRARFDLKLALYFAKQTALALNYLHMSTPQIVHRDLKTENLLLDNHLNVKVCDFGLSCVKPPREVLKEQVGSPLWMAPEVLAGGTYDERCDVYSFALVLWEFFANQLPYAECEEFHQLVDVVVNQKKRPPIPAHTPPEISALIKQCWDADPAKRPSFATVVETVHEIVRQHKD